MVRGILLAILAMLLNACGGSSSSEVPARNKDGFVCKGVDKNVDEDPLFQPVVKPFGVRYATPTKLVPVEKWPNLSDDLNFERMDEAIRRQLERFKKISLFGSIQMGVDIYPLRLAEKSLLEFRAVLGTYRECLRVNPAAPELCATLFNEQMRSKFNMYEPNLTSGDPRYQEPKAALFTGYYTPTIRVTQAKDSRFTYAVYGMPSGSEKRSSSRLSIDFRGALSGLGLELYYTNDLFELYLAQVQGNGRIRVEGGVGAPGDQFFTFAGTNGQTWNFISKYMLSKNYIQDASVNSQRDFLTLHPQMQEEVYSSCPSYVYFGTSKAPPLGSGSVSVTQDRSVATDSRYYEFKGLLSYVVSSRPEENQNPRKPCGSVRFKDFSRFYLDQDTGGAIRGKARADLYFGEGDYAELAAYNQVRRGDIYFLMLKK